MRAITSVADINAGAICYIYKMIVCLLVYSSIAMRTSVADINAGAICYIYKMIVCLLVYVYAFISVPFYVSFFICCSMFTFSGADGLMVTLISIGENIMRGGGGYKAITCDKL